MVHVLYFMTHGGHLYALSFIICNKYLAVTPQRHFRYFLSVMSDDESDNFIVPDDEDDFEEISDEEDDFDDKPKKKVSLLPKGRDHNFKHFFFLPGILRCG